MVTPALVVQGLAVSYGPLEVCAGVDLELGAEMVGALTGANGAGKSTILKALAGVARATGSIRLFGEEIAGLPAEARSRRGLVVALGGRGAFVSLTVEESIGVGAWHQRGKAAAAALDEALSLFPTLAARRRQPSSSLSAGEQQLVVLARAVAARPRLLLVDELTLGLAGRLADEVAGAIVARPPVLLVDQSIGRALHLASWAWFLERGQVRFSGPAAELGRRRDLLGPVLIS